MYIPNVELNVLNLFEKYFRKRILNTHQHKLEFLAEHSTFCVIQNMFALKYISAKGLAFLQGPLFLINDFICIK